MIDTLLLIPAPFLLVGAFLLGLGLAIAKTEYAFFLIIPLLYFIGYVDVAGASPWNWVLAIAFLLELIRKRKRGCDSEAIPSLNRLIGLGCVFVFWLALSGFWSEIPASTLIMQCLKMLTAILAAGLTGLWLSRRGWHTHALIMVVATVSLSAFIGIAQHFGYEWAWGLRALFSGNEDELVQQQLFHRSRIVGLAYFTVTLSYQVAIASPLAFFGLYFAVLNRSWKKAAFFGVASVILASALWLLESDSAILGVVLALMVGALLIFFRRQSFARILRGLALAAAVAALLGAAILVPHALKSENSSNISRLPQWIVGGAVALTNPFGIGRGNYADHAQRYIPLVHHMRGSGYAFRATPHNQFMNTWVLYGLPGLGLMFLIYTVVFRRLGRIWDQSAAPQARQLALIFTASLIAYLVHSCFHNAGLFTRDVVHWILLGAFVSLGVTQRVSTATEFAAPSASA